MTRFLLCFIISLLTFSATYATRISGTVYDNMSNILPFTSILVKGTTIGTTTNTEGKYFLNLSPGNYILICRHVGYATEEKGITVSTEPVTLNFVLSVQQLNMSEIVVKSGGEDPAYEIIRQAIKKRPGYENQVDEFQCEVYIKGQLKLRDFPKSFLGQKIDFEDGDTSKRKMIYLSETIAKLSYQKPQKTKVEVISTRVSGQTDGFGLSTPRILSFYSNNVQISQALNPRGFVSPIADDALNFYRYRFSGSFVENDKLVNRIYVTPKRTYEPLFSGYINITEDDWRIHSINLLLTKQSQLELADTLHIEQLYMPVATDVWMIQSQVIYPSVKLFGFDATGSFVSVFSSYELQPAFAKKFFNNTVLKFDTASNKRPKSYWDEARPVPLLAEEAEDYREKDSLEIVRKDPKYLDSIDRKNNKLTATGLILYGQNFSRQSKEASFGYSPLLESVSFNTVEGWAANLNFYYNKRFTDRRRLSISPTFRYGFTNRHFNADLSARYNFGKGYFNNITIAGGKKVFQINNSAPVRSMFNTITTLWRGYNYLKVYEAWFGRINYSKGIGEGFTIRTSLQYQDRIPLENTDSAIWGKSKYLNRRTPNYPTALVTENFKRHQAAVFNLSVSFRPGTRYIELPDRKINIGSKHPLFTLAYTKGLKNVLGSDVDYDKWRFTVSDEINFKLQGILNYRFAVGGFLNNNRVELPDYQHFNGNRMLVTTPYLNSFQLLPYYDFSTTQSFYTIAHVEHHFNGFLTNKIPYIKRLNLRLVLGVNAFYVSKGSRYTEFMGGVENVLKIFRIDFIQSYLNGNFYSSGVRLGIRGLSGLADD